MLAIFYLTYVQRSLSLPSNLMMEQTIISLKLSQGFRFLVMLWFK
jgi:hypothetical protein